MSEESDFRDWLRGGWPGWVDGREPVGRGSARRRGWGSGSGAPDLTLGVVLSVSEMTGMNPSSRRSLRVLLPCELKVATLGAGGTRLALSGIEDSQREWHARAAHRQVITAFVAGVRTGARSWRPFVMRYAHGATVRELSEVAELPAEPQALYRALSAWYEGQWMGP